MQRQRRRRIESRKSGGVKPMVLLWALGIPIPLILIFALMKGCV